MSSNPLRRILITGATGKQGGALLSALVTANATVPFHLVALTRNADSDRARKLASTPNVSVLEGDLDDVPAIFQKSQEPFYGVFSVQSLQKPDREETQGKALIDAALNHGVRHFVYSSVDRGGPEKSDNNPTPIPHFKSKHNIELHLKKMTTSASSSMQWTIIRPVAFMDNFTNDFIGKAFRSMWELDGSDTKLQVVAVKDIGIVAAEAFKNPEQYTGQAISLATDEVTPKRADEIFMRVTGSPQPKTFSFIGRILRWILRGDIGVMLDWFKQEGYGAKPEVITKEYPQNLSFETWLATASAFRRS